MRKGNLIGLLVTLGMLGGLVACVSGQPINAYRSLRLRSRGAAPIAQHALAQAHHESDLNKPLITLSTPVAPDVAQPTPSAFEASDLFPDKHRPRGSSIDTSISWPNLAQLWLNPQAGIVTRTRFFTSACFGPNPLQKEDFLRPLDWWVSKREMGPNNACLFGFDPEANGLPHGSYSVGNYNGLPLYYIVPPEAFEKTRGRLVLSEASLIVDPAPYGGWESLGFIVISADGIIYEGWAADVFRPGGVIKSIDGTKSISFPTNENIIFKPLDNGGNYGFAGFPMMIAEKNLSFAFTGSPSGGPPPRMYFAVRVDELDPRATVKTTAQMSNQDLDEMAHEFDQRLTGIDRIAHIGQLEKDALVDEPEISLRPKEQVTFEFSAQPGTILSSVHVFMWLQTNSKKKEILEMDPDILVDGRVMYSGTGFEDFGGEGFYSGGKNPLGAFFPIDSDGYLAARYLTSGPVLHDGKVRVRLKNPDVGTAIKLRVEVKVIDPDPTALK